MGLWSLRGEHALAGCACHISIKSGRINHTPARRRCTLSGAPPLVENDDVGRGRAMAGGERRILVIEDDSETAGQLADALVASGYRVDLAGDGDAGLRCG